MLDNLVLVMLGINLFVVYGIFSLQNTIHRLIRHKYNEQEKVEEPEIRSVCPTCKSVNSQYPCDDIVDGVNHTGLGSNRCIICGTVRGLDYDTICDLGFVNNSARVDGYIIEKLKIKMFNCPSPSERMVTTILKLAKHDGALRIYTADLVAKALLRDDEDILTRLNKEIEAAMLESFPECYIEEG